MRGNTKALPLTVNFKIHSIIKDEIVKGSLPQKYAKRLGFILDGIEGESIYSTMVRNNVAFKTVQKWRIRWESSVSELITFCDHGVKHKPAKDYEIFKKYWTYLVTNRGLEHRNALQLIKRKKSGLWRVVSQRITGLNIQTGHVKRWHMLVNHWE
ncbi:MAG: hypothetical protein IPO37_03685 [Saprospiraceae bacterium]|nr:hypothetical protein [Saprospiraceae bacterium]